jgi:hypothetical protein
MLTLLFLICMATIIPSTWTVGFFVRKDFVDEGFYFVVDGPDASKPFRYLEFKPGQKIKEITWDGSNQKVFKDICVDHTLPSVIRDVQFYFKNYALVLGDDEAQCYNLGDNGCYQFFSRPGKFEGRFENQNFYFTSLWDPEQPSTGIVVATEPTMTVKLTANTGNGKIRFLDSIKTTGPGTPNTLLQQVENVFKIIKGSDEKSYTIAAKIEYIDVLIEDQVAKMYYICTEAGEMIAIDPNQQSLLWTLDVEPGRRCTSIFLDYADTGLVYMTTTKPNLISVNPSDRSVSKRRLPEMATYIFRDDTNPSSINLLNVITKKKLLSICHSSCSMCEGPAQPDCLPGCDDGCATCSSTNPADCRSCDFGFYLEFKSCLPCPKQCNTCDSRRKCLSCSAR